MSVSDINYTNHFLGNVCKAWCSLTFHNPINNFGNQVLWNNSFIRMNGKPVVLNKLVGKCLINVRDLFHKDGTALCFRCTFNLSNIPFTI